jgi:fido (protein-threonine AMPylation protein)
MGSFDDIGTIEWDYYKEEKEHGQGNDNHDGMFQYHPEREGSGIRHNRIFISIDIMSFARPA